MNIEICKKTYFRHWINIGFYSIPLLMIICAIPTIFSNSIWVDEAYSLELVKHSWSEVVRIDAMDVHPPLYYLILKLFSKITKEIFGYNYIWIGKFVSMIPYCVLLAIGFTGIRKRYGQLVAFLFNILILGMPQMFNFSTEIRMYSFGMLFVFGAFWQMCMILQNDRGEKKYYVGLAVFSALAAYTHYFACVSALVIYVELFLILLTKKKYKKLRAFFLSGFGVVILYLPWLLVFFEQVKSVREDYWIEPVSVGTIVRGIGFLLFTGDTYTTAFVLLLFVIAGISACILFIGTKSMESLCGIGVWAGTIGLGIILSLIIRPIFESRYIMSASACLWFGVALGLDKVKTKGLRMIIVALSIFVCLLGCKAYIQRENGFRIESELTIDELARYIDEDTIIVNSYDHVQRVVSYFYPENISIIPKNQKLTDISKIVYSDCNLQQCECMIEYLKDKGDNIIVLDYDNSMYDSLTQNGFQLEQIGGMRMDWYFFTAYKLRN